jgi:hypothetical protein
MARHRFIVVLYSDTSPDPRTFKISSRRPELRNSRGDKDQEKRKLRHYTRLQAEAWLPNVSVAYRQRMYTSDIPFYPCISILLHSLHIVSTGNKSYLENE